MCEVLIMIERRSYLKSLLYFKDKNLIKVITGIRRCGKSTMFELYQDYLIHNGVGREQVIAVNLEDGDYRGIRTAEKLYEYINEKLIADKMNYVFIDDERVIIRTKLEKPSKIKGLALI